MQAALERGPDWVKDHLNDLEIERVREFLRVEEMIKFRCRTGVPKPSRRHRRQDRSAPKGCRYLIATPIAGPPRRLMLSLAKR